MELLVIRLSAMGDVALTVPVLRGFMQKYPDTRITLVTRQNFAPFFNALPEIRLFHPDFRKRHKGLYGIYRLFRDLRRLGKYDHIIDLHDVIRTKILLKMFKAIGIKATLIHKGRTDKKALVTGKVKKQLKHTVQRYCDVFAKAGFPVEPAKGMTFVPKDDILIKVSSFFLFGEDDLNIGVAPYAKHPLKMWPEDYMVELLRMISARQKAKFWLFGSYDEIKGLYAFNEKFPSAFLVAGKLSLEEELAVMGRLDFMIAMDSSNMHMAALSGTKVVSIWGGTDPMAGFGGWQQPEEYSIRIPVDELECRPCTVYGKGKCRRGDLACMDRLTPEIVFERLVSLGLV